LLAQPVRQRNVICVLPCDVTPASQFKTAIQGKGQSKVRLCYEPDPWIPASSKDIGRIIRRPIVNDDEFEIRERLSEDALYRFASVLGAVVDG
jgi:hypothetical protein